jgi:hypothetical protein
VNGEYSRKFFIGIWAERHKPALFWTRRSLKGTKVLFTLSARSLTDAHDAQAQVLIEDHSARLQRPGVQQGRCPYPPDRSQKERPHVPFVGHQRHPNLVTDRYKPRARTTAREPTLAAIANRDGSS